jgi:D-alanyl-D-alanine carboxypeptidase (penicillin-binding protein 5/6)
VAATFRVSGPAPALPWPAQGYAYITVEGVGELGASGPVGAEVSIASVAKAMTAYQVPREHSLGPNDDIQTIDLATALFDALKSTAGDESDIVIQTRERLTLRQPLQGMLLASAENMAKQLWAWDVGSIAGFVDQMKRPEP